METPEFILPDCAKCMCFDDKNQCICPSVEKYIKNYVAGNIHEPLTDEQREYCISTADWCWEGAYSRAELEVMNDKDLASVLLNGWYEYARSI